MNSLYSWEHLTKCPTDVRPTVRRGKRKGAYSEAHTEAEGPHRVYTPYLGNHLILSSCNSCWRDKIPYFHLQSCHELKHAQSETQTLLYQYSGDLHHVCFCFFNLCQTYIMKNVLRFCLIKLFYLVESSHPGRQSPHTALLVVEQLPFWKRLMSPQSRQGLHFCRLRSSLKRLLRQGTHRASSP